MQKQRLSPDVNRILFVRNLPFKIATQEMYDLFGAYGSIRQIRLGSAQDTRGTAYVVYDDIYDAKTACEHLSGYNLSGRYLICLYHQQNRIASHKTDLKTKERELAEMKRRAGL